MSRGTCDTAVASADNDAELAATGPSGTASITLASLAALFAVIGAALLARGRARS